MPTRRHPLAGAVVAALLTLVAACSSSPAPTDQAAPPGRSTGTAGAVTPITWRPCGRGAECGTLTVPLDPAQPDGSTIDLAVARRRALQPGARIGSLVFNPGGPGASGVDLVTDFGMPFTALQANFDIVSWDPRGVGGSVPLGCDDAGTPYRELDWDPDDDAERRALDEGARAVAERCDRSATDRLRHLATATVAADLDRLRAALGDERLTYVGFSYGTSIGLAYAEQFPGTVRAMVLDGVVNPHEDLEAVLTGQAVALEDEVDEAFTECRQRSCALPDPAAAYDELARTVDRDPLPAGDRRLGPNALAFAVIASTYDPSATDSVVTALAAARNGQGAPLRALADGYYGSASYAAYVGVTCVDLPHPEGTEAFDAMVERIRRRAPRFGAVVANDLRPCAFWPAPTTGRPGPVRAEGTPPILVVGATGDVATPYASAERVAGDLAAGVLLTREGEGHTSYSLSECIESHVDRYLVDLVVPAAGTRCS